VVADQQLRRLVHRRGVQRLRHEPSASALQRQGRAAMSGAELLRGFAIPPGLDLPLPEPEP